MIRRTLQLLCCACALWAPAARADDAFGGAVVHEEKPPPPHVPVLTRPPSLVHAVEPAYPEEAKRDRLTGEVTLQVDIGADGKVAGVQVTKGAGHGFDEAALAAVKQFVFSPAEIDGKPAPVRIAYTQHFVFKEAPRPAAASAAAAPKYPISLKGRVLERGSRKPVPGAAVKASVAGAPPAIAGVDGSFQLRLPPGPAGITVIDPGHLLFHTLETIRPGEQLEATYYLMPKAYGLYETVVHGTREKKEVTRHTLEREELEKVPGSMGDPIRVLQDLPGVARAPFLSGQLIVRGAAPSDTGTYMDGVELPLLFHFLGGPSVVNPEFLDRIDFYPGGFGARYGRAIGGIVDVDTRSPKKDAWHGSAKIDLIDSGAYVAAPVTDGLTVSAAARRSYIDAILPLALPVLTGSDNLLVAPRYYDYQARTDYHPPGSKSSYRLFAFGSDDLLNVVATGLASGQNFQVNDHTAFTRLMGDWTYKDGRFTASTRPFVGRNLFSLGLGAFQIDDTDDVGGVREDLAYELFPWLTLRGGLDLQLTKVGFTLHLPARPDDYRPFPGEQPDRPLQTYAGSLGIYDYGEWLESELRLPGRIAIFPGLRTDQYRLNGRWRPALDPRLIVRKELGTKERPTALKGSVGLYHESPQVEQLDPQFGNPDLPLEAAFQTSLGVEHTFTDVINVDVTGFYNRRYQLAERTNELVTQPDGSLKRITVDDIGLGRAYGVEVLLRHEITRHFFGWVAYTLSWSQERVKGGAYHWSSTDERHLLTLIGQYRFGNGWELGGRFRLATGIPDTPVVGSTFDADTQSFHAINGEAGSIRQPTFNQLDLRVDREWLFDRWVLGVYLDVQNVYNATNQEGVIHDYRDRGQMIVPGIPFLPTLGVKGSF